MLSVIKLLLITVKIPLIEEQKLISLTHSSCHNSKKIDARENSSLLGNTSDSDSVALFFIVEPKHLFLE